MRLSRRAYVVGGYMPNGGAFMAYHVGRVLQEHFNFALFTVHVQGDRGPSNHFSYDVTVPEVSLTDLETQITSEDVLICNPSFSHLGLGARLPGRKLMYVQGWSTYQKLDRHFDHYVAVSSFVADHLSQTEGLQVPIIPAFIQLDLLPKPLAWAHRTTEIFVYRKAHSVDVEQLYDRLIDPLYRRGFVVDEWRLSSRPQAELWSALNRSKVLLYLSMAEGFGLVPLEAMAIGTPVISLDTKGDRDFLKESETGWRFEPNNPLTAVELVEKVLAIPPIDIILAARSKARSFSKQAFYTAWRNELSTAFDL